MENKTRSTLRFIIVYVVLIALLLLSLFLSVNIGTQKISFFRILEVIFNSSKFTGTTEYTIIMRIRLPRLLLAGLLGGALALSGYLLQVFFRNPIAGPFVLGISSSAKMFVGFAMIIMAKYMTSSPLIIQVIAALLGSLAAMGLILIFSKRVKNMAMLLVIGVMIGYICAAITDFFITFANDSQIVNLTHWSMGSFSGAKWKGVLFAAVTVLPLLLITFIFSKPIGAYQLGEGYAQNMGINVKAFRKIIILLSSLLSAVAAALVGPISFVGIAVPHIAKKLLNTAKPIVAIPAVFLTGCVFCIFCDLIARTIFSPVELAVGTVTSIFGAPIVIILLVKKHRGKE